MVLPKDLRARVETEAERRGLKLSPAIRALVAERVRELDADDELSQAETWQRAQAWATWEKIKGGDRREVPRERLARIFETALRKLEPRRARRR